jgi:hypothetical protein
MQSKHQHSEQSLEGAIRQVDLLCGQAAEYPGEYEVPSEKTVLQAKALLREFQKAGNPQIILTQDGEFVLTWTHFADKFKAIVRDDGLVVLFQNKNCLDHDLFACRLTSVPA